MNSKISGVFSAFLLLALNSAAYAAVYDAKLTINYKTEDSFLAQQSMDLVMQGHTVSTAASWNPVPVNIVVDNNMMAKLNAGQTGPFSGAVTYKGTGTFQFTVDIEADTTTNVGSCVVTATGAGSGVVYSIPNPVPKVEGTSLICNIDVTLIEEKTCDETPTLPACLDQCPSNPSLSWCAQLCEDYPDTYEWCDLTPPVTPVTQATVTIKNQVQ